MKIRAYDGVTGGYLFDMLPIKAEYTKSLNTEGSLTFSARVDGLYAKYMHPWRIICALCDEIDVIAAGYVKSLAYNQEEDTWGVTCGDGSSILEKRLVIKHDLDEAWEDGLVVIDEENPSATWQLSLGGSYSDIIGGLIRETKKWGQLPISDIALTGGDKVRNYNSYDCATVLERIQDLGELQNGIEYRFDPYIQSDSISFRPVVSDDGGELVDHVWDWNTKLPKGAHFDSDQRDEEYLCTQAYMTGGRNEDTTLVARSVATKLTGAGFPVLQVADNSHNDVSEINTLLAYAKNRTYVGDREPLIISLNVEAALYDVHIGDHARVRMFNYITNSDEVVEIKITDITGNLESPLIQVQGAEVFDEQL